MRDRLGEFVCCWSISVVLMNSHLRCSEEKKAMLVVGGWYKLTEYRMRMDGEMAVKVKRW